MRWWSKLSTIRFVGCISNTTASELNNAHRRLSRISSEQRGWHPDYRFNFENNVLGFLLNRSGGWTRRMTSRTTGDKLNYENDVMDYRWQVELREWRHGLLREQKWWWRTPIRLEPIGRQSLRCWPSSDILYQMHRNKCRWCTAKGIRHDLAILYDDLHTVFESNDITGIYVYPQILSRGLESRSETNWMWYACLSSNHETIEASGRYTVIFLASACVVLCVYASIPDENDCVLAIPHWQTLAESVRYFEGKKSCPVTF